MNRLHHIKETLPKNIKDNLDYKNVEFILLDYGSSDGLQEWVLKAMSVEINKGILKYYNFPNVEYFDRSHSRNLAFKLATGDVLCNVDADNYTGKGFAKYVNEKFSYNSNIYLVADTKKRFYFLRNAFGRFCISKQDFEELGGLDEEMKSYGSETVDLYNRLDQKGVEECLILNTNFLKAISHGDEERVSNEYFLKSLSGMYIKFISHEESEFILMYKDGSAERGIVVPEKKETHLPGKIKHGSLKNGKWKKGLCKFDIEFEKKEKFVSVDNKIINENHDIFYHMSDPDFLMNVAKNYSFMTNVDKMRENSEKESYLANNGIYGSGKVTDHKKNSLEVL